MLKLTLKGAKVELAGGVEGYIRAADLTNEVAAGDVVEAKYTGVDRKARIVHLSVKAKDQAEEAAAVAKREYQNKKMLLFQTQWLKLSKQLKVNN